MQLCKDNDGVIHQNLISTHGVNTELALRAPQTTRNARSAAHSTKISTAVTFKPI